MRWYVYVARDGVLRGFPRTLKPGQMKPGERFVGLFGGVSRRTALAQAKAILALPEEKRQALSIHQ